MITIDHSIAYPTDYGTLYDKYDTCLGTIENELQLFDIQIKIAKEHAEGYYINWRNQTICFDSNGTPDCWPEGWGDQSQYAFSELRHTRKGDFEPTDYDWRHS